jgi:hypothetical protein
MIVVFLSYWYYWYDAMVVNYASSSVVYDRSNVYRTGHRCNVTIRLSLNPDLNPG